MSDIKKIRIRFPIDTAVDFESVPRDCVGRLQMRPRTVVDKEKGGKMEAYFPAGTELTLTDFVGSGLAEVVT